MLLAACMGLMGASSRGRTVKSARERNPLEAASPAAPIEMPSPLLAVHSDTYMMSLRSRIVDVGPNHGEGGTSRPQLLAQVEHSR